MRRDVFSRPSTPETRDARDGGEAAAFPPVSNAVAARRFSRLWALVDSVLLVAAGVSLWNLASTVSSAPREAAPPLIARGTQLVIPGVDWSTAQRHVVLRLAISCRECELEAPFYAELAKRVQDDRAVRLTIVTADSAHVVRQWLTTRSIEAPHVVSHGSPERLGFLVIPTVLMVDSFGRVTDIQLGRTDGATRLAIVERALEAQGPPLDNSAFAEEIDEAELARRQKMGALLVLDVRDRVAFAQSHRQGALNIPWDELATRTAKELAGRPPIVIDCNGLSAVRCRVTARSLSDAITSPVTVLLP